MEAIALRGDGPMDEIRHWDTGTHHIQHGISANTRNVQNMGAEHEHVKEIFLNQHANLVVIATKHQPLALQIWVTGVFLKAPAY